MMERWKFGMMGKLFPNIPVFQYSNIPERSDS
jgi:hypothetical protein